MTHEELLTYQDFVRQIPVADNVIEYAVSLVAKTRPGREAAPDFVNNYINYGAGPRASQYLLERGIGRPDVRARRTVFRAGHTKPD